MASSVVRPIFHKFISGRIIPSLCGGHSPRSAIISRCCWSKLGGDDRMMSTTASESDDTPPSRTSPWLMLPPEGNVYKFYNLAERKVMSIKRESEAESPVECVGSSHGWIALFNRRNDDLFLWNPRSGRHIQLPPMEPPGKWGPAKVLKLVVSESACRAMMIYGPLNRLAHCSPGDPSCDQWTPVGGRFRSYELILRKLSGGNIQVYEDLVYCKTHKWFITIHAFQQLDLELRDAHVHRLSCFCPFDIWEPWDPPVDGRHGDYFDYYYSDNKETPTNSNSNSTECWVKDNMAFLKHKCLQIPYIVHVDHSDQLYMVFQFVMLMPMNPNDPTTPVDQLESSRFDCWTADYPSKTVGFVVLKVKADGEDAKIVDDLDGLAMFVGINNSFALPASDFPELKPDSIYFTDAKRIASIDGRNDVGIFDYRNKTVHGIDIFQGDDDMDMDRCSSSPGTEQVTSISPVWFTPAN